MRITVLETSQDLYITDVQGKWFTNKQEQMAWVGKCDCLGDAVLASTASPLSLLSIKPETSIITLSNGSTTDIQGISGGQDGQMIQVVLNDTNTKMNNISAAFARYFSVVNRYIDGSFTSTNYAAAALSPMFDDTGHENDCLTFGMTSTATDKFCGVQINVQTACNFVATFVWEYWNGSAWTTLITSNLAWASSIADHVIMFNPPADWVPVSYGYSGNVGYWIRYRISAYTSGSEGGAGHASYHARPGKNYRLSSDLAVKSTLSNVKAISLFKMNGYWTEINRLEY